MTFDELLEQQEALQDALGTMPQSFAQLQWQLLEEAGEIAREMRTVSRWWSWKGQKRPGLNRERLAEELADMLHFILLGVLVVAEPGLNRLNVHWRRFADYSCSDPSHSSLNAIDSLTELLFSFYAHDDDLSKSLCSFMAAANSLGITREEIERAYLEKVQENLKRIKG